MTLKQISGETQVLGIIADPIDHVMSPVMHNAILGAQNLNWRYIPFHVRSQDLPTAVKGLKALNIQGFNVTIPHKVAIIPYLDGIEGVAQKIGAVNTVKRTSKGLIGRNTDASGALQAIREVQIPIEKSQVMIFGAGGAARAIAFAVAPIVDRLILVNRSEDRMQTVLKALRAHQYQHVRGINLQHSEEITSMIRQSSLLINATPVGMFPHGNRSILSREQLHPSCAVFDMVYHPNPTKLLQFATAVGCQIVSGLDMLVNQGAEAFEWWTGIKPQTALMKQAVVKAIKFRDHAK